MPAPARPAPTRRPRRPASPLRPADRLAARRRPARPLPAADRLAARGRHPGPLLSTRGGEWLAEPVPVIAGVTSAAVLGRAGEVEPVAAALALALRRETRARAATVAVVGAVPAEVDGASCGGRRSPARREARGARARRCTCAVGSRGWGSTRAIRSSSRAGPARSRWSALRRCSRSPRRARAAIDEALGEQDLLVIVASDPEGPLARLAAAGLERVPVLTVRPLGRGPGRALARAGVRPARSLRHLHRDGAGGKVMTERARTFCTSAAVSARSTRGQASMLADRRARRAPDRDGDRRRGGPGGREGGGGAARGRPRRGRRRRGSCTTTTGGCSSRPIIGRAPNPNHLEKAEYLALGRTAALRVAGANGARERDRQLPGRGHDRARPGARRDSRDRRDRARARRAARRPSRSRPRPSSARPRRPGFATGGGYSGPLATRQGERMRPDVALAFDRMEAAARADGVALHDQQRLPLRRRAGRALGPPSRSRSGSRAPGTSLHRNAHRARSRPARRVRAGSPRTRPAFTSSSATPGSPGTTATCSTRATSRLARRGGAGGGGRARRGGSGDGAAGVSHGAVPGFVPARFAPMLRTAAQRWNVSAKLLAAQLYAGVGLQPVRGLDGRGAGDRAVHACHGAGHGAGRTRSTPSRRSMPRRI